MNKKILLVDDEPDILELIGYNLRQEGYDVFTAENGKQGIDMARSVNPDLIILDVMMPEMDGMEVCNIIRSDAKLSHTTIAFLTARGEDYSQVAGFDAGGDDYITKPVKPKVLVSRVKALCVVPVPTRPSYQMSGSASPLTWTGSPFCRKEKSSPCPKRNLNCSTCSGQNRARFSPVRPFCRRYGAMTWLWATAPSMCTFESSEANSEMACSPR